MVGTPPVDENFDFQMLLTIV